VFGEEVYELLGVARPDARLRQIVERLGELDEEAREAALGRLLAVMEGFGEKA
jgi:hypothetical protein